MKFRAAYVVAALLSFAPIFAPSFAPMTFAQTPTAAASALPRLVRFGGAVKDLNGNPLTGVVGITFALYSEQTGGAALWIETQNVTADSNGHYVALLGSTKPDGLPTELFITGQARWVGVQVSGQAQQPRVLLVSAPYAFKAGDAETIGGLPPSAFVLAAPASGGLNNATASSASPSSASSSSASPATSSDVTTTGGTVNAVPLFTTSTNIQNSILTQTGTTSVSVAGALKLPATGTATANAGKNSQTQNFVASSFNSSTSTAQNQTFQWRAEPASNDTASPSGTLNLLYGLGAAAPAETGLKLGSKGQFTFATGQTFPGTGTITGITTASGSGLSGGGTTGTLSLSVPAAGITNTMLKSSTLTLNPSTAGGLTVPGAMTLGDTYTIGLKTCNANQVLQYSGTAWGCATLGTGTGTVTSVGSGAGLTGGPITTSGTLSIANAGVTNAMLANSKITLNSGTGISAPGAMTLGDTYTLGINTSVVPQLAAANTLPTRIRSTPSAATESTFRPRVLTHMASPPAAPTWEDTSTVLTAALTQRTIAIPVAPSQPTPSNWERQRRPMASGATARAIQALACTARPLTRALLEWEVADSLRGSGGTPATILASAWRAPRMMVGV
jgi:hypothetical protein